MVRCHEMSQITPTTALVAATRTAATYQGTPHGRPSSRARAVDAPATGTATEPPCERSPGGPVSRPSRLTYRRYSAACRLAAATQWTSLPPHPAPPAQSPGRVPAVLPLGRGQTEFVLDSLKPGPHRVIAVVADWKHVPLKPLVVDTVRFTVK